MNIYYIILCRPPYYFPSKTVRFSKTAMARTIEVVADPDRRPLGAVKEYLTNVEEHTTIHMAPDLQNKVFDGFCWFFVFLI